MSEETIDNKIINKYIKGSIRVVLIVYKIWEIRLRWVGYVLRRRKIKAEIVVNEKNVKEKEKVDDQKEEEDVIENILCRWVQMKRVNK